MPAGNPTPEELAAANAIRDPAKRQAALDYLNNPNAPQQALDNAGGLDQANREDLISNTVMQHVGGDRVSAQRLATLYTRAFSKRMTAAEYVNWVKSLSPDDRTALLGDIDKIYTTGDPFFGLTGGDAHGMLDRGWQRVLQQYIGKGSTTGQAAGEQLTPEQKYLQDNQARIQAFITKMMGPLDPNDPDVARIAASIKSRASTDVYGRGIGGGMADAAVNKVMSDSLLGMQQQRQQIGLAAAQGAISDERTFLAQQDAARAAMAQAGYQNELAGYETRRGQLQGTMGMAGGIIGGIYGGAAGAQAGAGVGSAVGGYMAGGPPSYSGYSSPYYRTGAYDTTPRRSGGSGMSGGW